MKFCEMSFGEQRTKVDLLGFYIGEHLIVCLYNYNSHIGAVAIGDYDHETKRASCSVITRIGHKDDLIAYEAAYSISKFTKKPVCVVAGIHVDKISRTEIKTILKNCRSLTDQFCRTLKKKDSKEYKI